MLIQELYRRQAARGFLSDDDLRQLAARLDVPLYRLQELTSFYPHFRRDRPPSARLQVCRDMACHMSHGGELARQVRAQLPPGTDVEIEEVSCLGRCDRAPACLMNDRLLVQRHAEELAAAVHDQLEERTPAVDSDQEHTPIDVAAWQIESAADPPYDAVRAYLADPDPERIIGALETAGLLGMGGAGGRTYKKWNDVRHAAGARKYVVCNGDESEPGTFKDRELLLRTPHRVLEGIILGGLVVGAQQGYVYLRHEYTEQIAAMRRAIDEARRAGVCGRGFWPGGDFEVEVFVSPGGYICGEQSALIEAMEDQRAEPRNRPPQLQTNGLFDQPTLLNNVETFAWVPAIVRRGGDRWFAEAGEDRARGRRLFSISGDVARPGVYEVPCGITLGALIEQHARGIRDGRGLQAVALSGTSGGFLPRVLQTRHLGASFVATLPAGTETVDVLDLPLDIRTFRSLGAMLGAGIVVYDETRDLVDEALACLRFFRNESCGKCVPCRIGSEKLVEIGAGLKAGGIRKEELAAQTRLIDDLAETMQITSICGLGQVAPNPLQSLLKYFPEHVRRLCP